MGRMIGCAIVVLCLAHHASAAPAASDDKARARALYESGTAHYNLGELKEALDDFKKAYRLYREPVFLFNIAQCYRRLHDAAQAAEFYRAYRREAPSGSNTREIDRLIEEMDRAVAERRAHAPPEGIEAPGAGEAPGGAARGARPEAPAAGTTAAPGESGGAAGSARGDGGAAVASPAATDDGSRGRRAERLAGYVIGGVGVGLALGGLGAALVAQAASDDVSHAPSGHVFDPGVEQRFQTGRAAAIGLFVAGGVCVVAGATLLGLGYRAPATAHARRAAAWAWVRP